MAGIESSTRRQINPVENLREDFHSMSQGWRRPHEEPVGIHRNHPAPDINQHRLP
jgi:hypothetical protein